MLEVDTGSTGGGDNDLQLVIPSICTRPNLSAILEVIGTAKEIVAQLGKVVRMCVVQTHDEQCIVYNFETRFIGSVFR